ncbi:MAG: hypothetical protein CMO80_23105 [Verrucomicrobiales bacterium]|nr:hypothetical protein [Verrucomicrobiales bacterium]|tara:strand:- start:313 stop:2949 length:2637 start_codon:yes stop_codon:yes gene_type:complete
MTRFLALILAGSICAEALADERLDHWAWQPLKKEFRHNSIDAFLNDALKGRNLTMSSKADRRTLMRRLSFDLHGLPPSPEAIKSFTENSSPNAYAQLVNTLLDSPHYGERYARHWLDIAHYADTHGFERDKRRPHAWRYRDYVIKAFNDDKPYDRFLREQIAGDVLWPNKDEATVATGFLAAGPWDFVGQKETRSPILRRSARALDLDDMVTQVMTATMGMTVNCARCHDHKLDPITQKEYYQMTAVFAGVKRQERVTSARAQREYDKQKIALTKQRNQLAHRIGRLEGRGIDLADVVGGGNGLGSGSYGNGIDPRNAVVQTRKFGNLGNVTPNRFSESKFPFVDGVFVADGTNGTGRIPVSSTGITVTGIPTTSRSAWDHIRHGPVASQHSPTLDGTDFTKDGNTSLGIHANAGITFDLAAIREATGHKELRFDSRVGYFGAAGGFRADVWVFVDGKSAYSHKHLQREKGLQQIDISLPETARFLTLLATDGGNNYSHDQIGFTNPKLAPATPSNLSAEGRAELAQLRKQAKDFSAKLEALGSPPKFYGVIAEKEMPAVRMQRRGNPEAEFGDVLAPGAIAALAMLKPDLGNLGSSEQDRRKALANWITHPGNPLTARVIVNRLWHWHFGEGLVDTPSDFGLGGGRPSHPELLDWLGTRLVENNWSLKSMHRLILNSVAYRQSSAYSADAPGTSIDANNRLLWRQNARRIEAEALRDSVLFVSGRLNNKRGGPGFEDFQYKEAYAPEYTYITADEPALWRRSIYRYIVRTTPNRFLTTLDCPDPANFTPKRLTTTTPLQSLALYNNDFMLRQARYFAKRVEMDSNNPKTQARSAFQHAFGREPSGEESSLATRFIRSKGLFALCRSLFNANEFVYVD